MSPQPAGAAATQPFGGPVRWDREGAMLQVAADRSLGTVLRRMHEENPDWVVVVRPTGSAHVYYYAFRSSELEQLATEHPERKNWSLESAMGMHEWMSSAIARGGRPLRPAEGQQGPAAARVVEFDAAGRVAAIGEREDMIPQVPAVDTSKGASSDMDVDLGIDLGPMRGGDRRGVDTSTDDSSDMDVDLGIDLGPMRESPVAAAPAAEIEVTLSAETKSEIDVGASARVPFQIELSAETIPLAGSQPARAKKDVPRWTRRAPISRVPDFSRSRASAPACHGWR